MGDMMILGPDTRERTRLEDLICSRGRHILKEETLQSAKGTIEAGRVSHIFCFYNLEDGTVLDLVQHLKDTEQKHIRVVVVEDFAESRRAAEALSRGAFDFLPVPLDPTEVAATIGRLIATGGNVMPSEEIRFEAKDGILVLQFPNEVSYGAAAEIGRLIESQLVAPERGAVVDLTHTRYFSSSGIGLLFILCDAFKGLGDALLICGARPHIRNTMRLAGVDKVYRFCETREEAVQLIWRGQD